MLPRALLAVLGRRFIRAKFVSGSRNGKPFPGKFIHPQARALILAAPSLSFNEMDIAANYEALRSRLEAACARAGRQAQEVLFLPVSKGQSPEAISAAVDLGLTVVGENKVQEAKAKIPLCSSKIRWHMIGHLQSNKCRDAVQLFQMIESVDSLPLAEELNKWADKLGRRMPILLEVNAAGEASKFGFSPERVVQEIGAINQLSRLEVQGLMTIAPYSPTPERARPFFKKLRELREECSSVLGAPLPHLSMGMSGDFEVAIEEGATIIRIGTALFGPRSYTKSKLQHES